MRISRRDLIRMAARPACLWLTSSRLLASAPQQSAAAPTPYGPLPSPRQRAWHELETYGFLHFSVNTFTDREWGMGDEDPAIFNPTDFNADQIVTSAKAGGLKQLIVTAKHHDGFCLWPSRYTEHTIARSPYKNGKGDIVAEMAAACARHGLKFGVYVSPWDRNNPEYGRPGYVRVYHGQLRELLTQYGKLHEVWFDGANGGDGYYGGAREIRKIDAASYYQWDVIRAMAHELQPDAVLFADEHMDVRWVGNEAGMAGDPCWPTMDRQPYTPQRGNSGVRNGELWNPAEVDVSIRPGWFWHPDENDQVRSPAKLLRLYFQSAGRGANLLLNVPPDRRGRIFEADALALKEFREVLDKALSRDLAQGARVMASSALSPEFAPANVLGSTPASAAGTPVVVASRARPWAALESDRSGAWLTLVLPRAVTFNLVRLREAIEYGVRIDEFAVEIWQDGRWQILAQHSCLGPRRLIRLDTPVTTRKVRLRIIKGAASPVVSEFGLYLLPYLLEEPSIERDTQGMVTLRGEAPGTAIFYTLDGSQPNVASPRYSAPFALATGGTVRALGVRTAGGDRAASEGIPSGGEQSVVVSREFDIAPRDWRVISATGDKPDNLVKGGVFLGQPNTPVSVIIDLAQVHNLRGFTLKPVSDRAMSGTTAAQVGPPARFIAWVSTDGQTWGEPAGKGEFANIAVNRSAQAIRFDAPVSGRYLRLLLPHAIQDKHIIGLAGIGILTR
ncbi:MAG: alpha-L-fucosidase [Steroidobacteraceae bacterium]